MMDNLTEFDNVFAVCEIVAKRKKIHLVRPPVSTGGDNLFDYIKAIAETSGFRCRQINLSSQWWKKDVGSLVAFYRDEPCALLPKKNRGYYLLALKTRKRITIDPAIAKDISATAFYFYTPLSSHIHKIPLFELWRFVGVQILLTIFLLSAPLGFGLLFNKIIANVDFLLLWQMIIFLSINALVVTLFRTTQLATQMRLQFKLSSKFAPAIWDKILKLPQKFFKNLSAGNIVFKANLAQETQESLLKSVFLFISGTITSIIVLIFLLCYSFTLTLAAVFLIILMVITISLLNLAQLKNNTLFYFRYGGLSTFVFESLAGLGKLRVADALNRVFKIWTRSLIKRTEAETKIKKNFMYLEVFLALFLFLSPLLLYALIITLHIKLSFGNLVAFNTAYSLLFIIIFEMTSELSNVVRTIPLWKQSRIFFKTKVEHESGFTDPGILTGEIKLDKVVFRYHASDQPLFKNLSLEISSGEFVAIVGPSGSGKTTLFKLLLGFETPESGEIYFDGINLQSLRLSEVRKQIGVVIQNSTLIPGTIFANIAGSFDKMTRLEAWEIAEKVGLAEFIRHLPMQMDTLITEGAITLSGGEIQRLVLARALAKRPKILLLDEATSALDNTTQAMVHNYLKQLNATQIIAAHRLSTVINAHRIIVVDQGSIVQAGTFNELMNQPGLFAQQAARQL